MARHPDQRSASHPVCVGGVDDRQHAGGQPVLYNRLQALEDVLVGPLVRFALADARPQLVGGNDIAGREMPGREGRLAGARRADQQHQGGCRNLDAFAGCGHDAAVEMSDRSTPARRLSAADFSVNPARVSWTAWRRDSMVASYVDRSTG